MKICSECGEPFLGRRDRPNAVCSRECVNKSEVYRGLKSELQVGKPSGMKGKRHSKESKHKMSLKHTGKIVSKKTRDKISFKLKGKAKPPGFGEKISIANKGRVFNKETIKKMSGPRTSMRGENHPLWKGGSSKLPYCPNWTKEYKEEIKKRDGYLCLNPCCYRTTNKLVIHHIDYTKTLCGPDNLITICNSCNSRANYDRTWHTEWYRTILKKKFNYIYGDF